LEKKPVAKRVKKKKKARTGVKNRGVGCLTPMGQRKHMARDNRDRAFALEYLRTMSQVKAAEAAGLSTKSASAGWQYLRKPAVQKIIREEFDKRAEAAGVTAEWIINKLHTFADASIKDFCAWDGHDLALGNSGMLTHEQAAPIKEVSSKANAAGTMNVSLKMHDAVKALELLAKIKGMLGNDGKSTFGGSDVRNKAAQLMDAVEQAKALTSPSAPPEGEPKDA
jgi:hypothetical protein